MFLPVPLRSASRLGAPGAACGREPAPQAGGSHIASLLLVTGQTFLLRRLRSLRVPGHEDFSVWVPWALVGLEAGLWRPWEGAGGRELVSEADSFSCVPQWVRTMGAGRLQTLLA